MASGRLRVALIFGGRSAEHEVSLRSACSIFEAMDRDKYEVTPVLITHEGAWYQRPTEGPSFDREPNLSENDRLLFLLIRGTRDFSACMMVDKPSHCLSMSFSLFCTALSERTALFRGSSIWLTYLTSAVECSHLPWGWTKSS